MTRQEVVDKLIKEGKLIKTGFLVGNDNLKDCWTIAGTHWDVNLEFYGGFYPEWNCNRRFSLETLPAYKNDKAKRAEIEYIKTLFDETIFTDLQK